MFKQRLIICVLIAVMILPAVGLTTFAVAPPWSATNSELPRGEGTVDDPWLIYDAAEFTAMASATLANTGYNGKFMKLVNDLDFAEITTYTVPGTGSGNNSFRASIDGNNKTISNLVVESSGRTALLGYYASGTIKDLTIGNTCSFTGTTNTATAGIANEAQSSARIINCRNYATITNMTGSACGIVGYADNVTIQDCYNGGSVTGKENVAGIVGNMGNKITLTGCVNEGAIIGIGQNVGGIAGTCAKGTELTNCYNTATITAINKSGSNVNYYGGIVGNLSSDANQYTKISNCYNSGIVSAGDRASVGGIAGGFRGNAPANTIIENCYNTSTAAVTGNQYTGGIAGNVGNSGGTIKNCHNDANVKSNDRAAGGITGTLGGAALIQFCYNTGAISVNYEAGGVAGVANASAVITDCYNTGDVTVPAKGSCGGIVGLVTNATIMNSYFSGTANGTEKNYGCVGEISGTNVFENLYYNNINTNGGINGTTTGTVTPLEAADFVSYKAAALLNVNHVELVETVPTIIPAAIWSNNNINTIFANADNYPVHQYVIKVGSKTYTEYVKLTPADSMNVIVTSYNDEILEDVSSSSNVDVISGEFSVRSGFEAGNRLKIFFWDCFEAAKPLCKHININN